MTRAAIAMAALFACATIVQGATTAATNAGEPERQWDFRVLLDGAQIGTHRYELQRLGDRKRLHSEARFDVRFLFFTAFNYRHRTTEEWAGDCLLEIDARTVTNGEFLDVDVKALPDERLTVRGEEKHARRYKVTAKDTELDLWYSEDRKWLALESVAKGGRIIRYELI